MAHTSAALQLDWHNPSNCRSAANLPLLPTVIQSPDGRVLGLAWSSERSLKLAIEKEQGIYESRQRGLWIKSPSGRNGQRLLSVSWDCDRDALLFTVIQRGTGFCHVPDNVSCFDAGELKLGKKENATTRLTLGYCYGHSESVSLDLLASAGIGVYKRQTARSSELIVKTHLHPGLEVLPCKPRDARALLDKGVFDVLLAYSNCIEPPELFPGLASHPCPVVKPVQVVAVSRSGGFARIRDSATPATILSEYPELTRQWLASEPEPLRSAIVVATHGNTEQFVAEQRADLGVMVRETGRTLAAHQLEVVHTLAEGRLTLYYRLEAYRREPRFFRELFNGLQQHTIYFYSVDTPHGFLSNFYPCTLVSADGRRWPSSEHYYQAHKFADRALQERVRLAPTALACCKLGRELGKTHQRPDWFENKNAVMVKDAVMADALRLKFADPELWRKLRATQPRRLVEHALRDAHFGCGVDGTGKNMLGVLLMELRDSAPPAKL